MYGFSSAGFVPVEKICNTSWCRCGADRQLLKESIVLHMALYVFDNKAYTNSGEA